MIFSRPPVTDWRVLSELSDGSWCQVLIRDLIMVTTAPLHCLMHLTSTCSFLTSTLHQTINMLHHHQQSSTLFLWHESRCDSSPGISILNTAISLNTAPVRSSQVKNCRRLK